MALISNGKEAPSVSLNIWVISNQRSAWRVDVPLRVITAPADAHIMAQIPEYDLVFSGLGD